MTDPVDKTLCVLPLRLFVDGEPTTFQVDDFMWYDHENDLLSFGRHGQYLLLGEAKEDDKTFVYHLSKDSFCMFGLVLSRLFGFGTVAVFEKRGRYWIWNFR